eukprot:EG_transcript_18848
MAAEAPAVWLEGFLWKKGASVLDGWRRRFFRLEHDGCLVYFAENSPTPRGSISLQGAFVYAVPPMGITIEGPKVKRRFELRADSLEEQRRWVAVLTSAQHLPEASTLPAPTVSPSGLYPSIDDLEDPSPTESAADGPPPSHEATAAPADRLAKFVGQRLPAWAVAAAQRLPARPF